MFGEMPTRPPDDEMMTFSGWSPAVDIQENET